MTTRVTLICSAPPATADFPGDPPAARAALARVTAFRVATGAICLCSPLARARDTAAALGLNASPEAALSETDFGAWAGHDPAAIMARDAEGFQTWLQDPQAAPHGGESFADVSARVAGWLAGLVGHDGQIVAITHPGPIQAALIHVLAAALTSARAIGVKPLSATRLVHDGRRWSVQIGN